MLVNRFWRSKSGNFAMMFAIALPAVLAAVGLALDVSNLMTARSTLQAALDSAVLASSRLADTSGSRTEAFDGFFRANISNRSDLVNASAELTVDQSLNSIKSSAIARADVVLNFGFMFGKSTRISVASSAFESTARLEVALVLDNTGSMGDSNMKALRDGATTLITVLQDARKQFPQRQIRTALVPFVTAVNINGDGFFKREWVDQRFEIPATETNTNGVNFEKLPNGKRIGHWELYKRLNPKNAFVNPPSSATPNPLVDWKGCVEARTSPYNLDDTKPDPLVPTTLFVPYFAPDEPGTPLKAQNADSSVYNNSYLADFNASGTDAQKQGSIAKYRDLSNTSLKSGSGSGFDYLITATPPLTSGPNYACPTPIAPLTEDLEKLKTEVAKMTYWNGSGTNVSEGLAWGYRVLSPNFGAGDAFNSEATSKVVVVFTDGENTVFGQNGTINKSDYGTYGYLSTARLDSTSNRSKALTNVNNMTQDMCTKLKAKGVRVFTVVLGADTAANRELYSKCASTPANYYLTKDQTQLKAAFQNIAFAISALYITN